MLRNMGGLSRSALENVVSQGAPGERVAAQIEMGLLDRAELELQADWAGSELLAGRLLARRGEFLGALDRLSGDSPEERRERAQLLATLGRNDDALALLDGSDDPRDRLATAQIHLQLGEPAPASHALPGALPAAADEPWPRTEHALRALELDLARGELALQSQEPDQALGHLRRADRAARTLGAEAQRPIVWSRLAEAYADVGHRWRALRAATRALDRAGERAPAAAVPGIHYRAFQVYGMFGHRQLADATVESGHAVVVQLASGITEHAFRETFFLDNRDCQRLVAVWKGDANWGRGVLEGR